MNELVRIVDTIDASPGPMYLATVVDVVGSAYRRPTARMLVLPDGSHVGSISGGCLERDLCRSAPELTKDGPRLVSFDTRRDSTDFNPRYNVGCSGIIYVLVEQVTRDTVCPSRDLRFVVESRQPVTTATVYQSDSLSHDWVGRRFFLDELPLAWKTARLCSVWASVESNGRPTCCEIALPDGSLRILIESIRPPKPLWIFGAGDDAIPLVGMADQLGWDVTVIDHKASRLSSERFPNARFVCEPWNTAVDRLRPERQAAAVLMTHCFTADRILLPRLLATDVGYVGVLGPKSRTGRVIKELYAAGEMPDVDSLDRLHTPVGLDIGASSAPEIAVAIVGEVIALDNGRHGGPLQQRQAPIHEPVRHELIDLVSVYEDTSSP